MTYKITLSRNTGLINFLNRSDAPKIRIPLYGMPIQNLIGILNPYLLQLEITSMAQEAMALLPSDLFMLRPAFSLSYFGLLFRANSWRLSFSSPTLIYFFFPSHSLVFHRRSLKVRLGYIYMLP